MAVSTGFITQRITHRLYYPTPRYYPTYSGGFFALLSSLWAEERKRQMAPKGNNVIPNAHFRKHWQTRVKTWFNQPDAQETQATHLAQKSEAGGATTSQGIASTDCEVSDHQIQQQSAWRTRIYS